MDSITSEVLANRIKDLEAELQKGQYQIATINGALLLAREFLTSLEGEVPVLEAEIKED